ncbi:FGGY family carbohydrate kinase [Novosphingobium panipatense]
MGKDAVLRARGDWRGGRRGAHRRPWHHQPARNRRGLGPHHREPITRAIVWQDRRTAEACTRLRDAGHEAMLQERTGLVVDPYFSGTKMRWILDNVPAARELGDRLALGTVESWLVWKLTGGLHVTDASNASRTQLLALDGADWDEDLLALFGVPRHALPEVVDTCGVIGTCDTALLGAPIPISGLAGDQQAATIGQHCLKVGETKATFGTGAFILTNMGEKLPRSSHRLLGTVLCQHEGKRTYALEGSIFAAGSLIKWLRDELGVIRTAGRARRWRARCLTTAECCSFRRWQGWALPTGSPTPRAW